jgi:hypothetical protein
MASRLRNRITGVAHVRFSAVGGRDPTMGRPCCGYAARLENASAIVVSASERRFRFPRTDGRTDSGPELSRTCTRTSGRVFSIACIAEWVGRGNSILNEGIACADARSASLPGEKRRGLGVVSR